MPWAVKRQGKRWAIVRSDTGKVVGHSDSRAKAQASVRARYAAVKEIEQLSQPDVADVHVPSTKHGIMYARPWRKARLQYLADNPVCVQCQQQPATEIDHNRAHKGDEKLFWDRRSWKALCKSCHSSKTASRDGGFGNPTLLHEQLLASVHSLYSPDQERDDHGRWTSDGGGAGSIPDTANAKWQTYPGGVAGIMQLNVGDIVRSTRGSEFRITGFGQTKDLQTTVKGIQVDTGRSTVINLERTAAYLKVMDQTAEQRGYQGTATPKPDATPPPPPPKPELVGPVTYRNVAANDLLAHPAAQAFEHTKLMAQARETGAAAAMKAFIAEHPHPKWIPAVHARDATGAYIYDTKTEGNRTWQEARIEVPSHYEAEDPHIAAERTRLTEAWSQASAAKFAAMKLPDEIRNLIFQDHAATFTYENKSRAPTRWGSPEPKVERVAQTEAEVRGREAFAKIVGAGTLLDNATLTRYRTSAQRAYHQERGAYAGIHVRKAADDKTYVHEMGHWLEAVGGPTIQQMRQDFIASRSEGAAPRWLGRGYGRQEVAIADKFRDAYVGKIYGEYNRGTGRYGGAHSEVISMGLQYLYQDPVAFAKEDPEHYNFIQQVLTEFRKQK